MLSFTLDIIEKYKDKITHFISEPDTGIYNAMNKGICLATGDLLNFMNANDTFASLDVIEKIVKAFGDNPDAQVSFGNVHFLDRKNSYSLFESGFSL